MKTKVAKILEIILFLLVFSLISSHKVLASEATVSANNCNVGENFTVTVNIPEDVSGYDIGGVTVAYGDGSTNTSKRAVKANMDLSWPGNYTVSFEGKVAGTATISVNGVILVNSSQAVVNTNNTLETSITITDPTPVQPSTNPTDTTDVPEQPAAPVNLSFKDTNETMYTNRRVNIRQNYGTDSNIIQTLAVGTELTRTGVSIGTKDGYSWSRVSYNGITGYVITGALTYDAPAPMEEIPEEKTEEQPQEQPEEPIENQEISEDDASKIAAIAEELGTIPEVGVNIMPFMFLGSSVACGVMMIEVKRKIAK